MKRLLLLMLLLFSGSGSKRIITLNRPKALNALSTAARCVSALGSSCGLKFSEKW